MIVGCPQEIKNNEKRVGITPASAAALVNAGHRVYMQDGAGKGSGFPNEEYEEVGAAILPTAEDVFEIADMIVKVKEPLEKEYALLREEQILFTYLHLAPDPKQTAALLERKVIGIAYETVQLPNGALPLLAPMSEVAGRMSTQIGAHLLESVNGGRGLTLGGVSGVAPAKVVVVGGGVVGTNAIKVAVGMGAQVTVLDVSAQRLAYLDDIYQGRIVTLMSNEYNTAAAVREADLVIGAVLIPGAKTPKIVNEYMVRSMNPGTVLVDVAIDQGGSIETIDRITTHDDPFFIKYGVIHYSVANIPGAVPRTSTIALTNATLPYIQKIADLGAERALQMNPALQKGLNVYKGLLTYRAVADAQGLPYVAAADCF